MTTTKTAKKETARGAALFSLCFASVCLLGFLGRGFLLAEAGFDGSANAGEHLLGYVGVWSGRRKFKIFLEGFGGARGRNHFVALQSCLADQVDAFLIISVGLIWVGGDALIESGNGVIHFAGIG
jgi:hypothetical protein